MSDQTLETLLDEKELSRLLRVSIGTLRFWRIVHKSATVSEVIAQLAIEADEDPE